MFSNSKVFAILGIFTNIVEWTMENLSRMKYDNDYDNRGLASTRT